MYQPLAGVRILDCTRLLPYHYCTQLLGDLGAEVVKVEEPTVGDYGRWGDASQSYESPAYILANRNKKSLKLNLKHQDGVAIFKKLVPQYDVIIESFRPGVMDRLGLGYDVIKEIKSDIIYCSTNGFGQTGPLRDKPGHDLNYLALSGILALTGQHTGRPVVPGALFSDLAGGGLFTAFAILAALMGKANNGQGQYIDVCQADVMASFNLLGVAEHIAAKKGQSARPVDLRGGSIVYNTYETKDGRFMSLGCNEIKFWRNFLQAVDRMDLEKYHLDDYREGDEATEAVKALMAGKSQQEWVDLLKDVDTCVMPVLDTEQMLADEQFKERGMVTHMDDPERGRLLQLGFPAKFSDELDTMRSPVPTFGQHTEEILDQLGYDEDEREALKQDGVI